MPETSSANENSSTKNEDENDVILIDDNNSLPNQFVQQFTITQQVFLRKTNVPLKFLKFGPGIDETLLQLFKVKISQNNDSHDKFVLYIEEFNLKRHLYYDIFLDEIIGMENYGIEKLPTVATKVVVFSMQTINSFHPIAYIFTGNNNAKEIRRMLFSLLDWFSFLKVLGILTSLTPNFIRLTKLLKVTPKKPFFNYNYRSYQYCFDPLQLIRFLRNILLTNDFKYGNKIMSWKYIVDYGNIPFPSPMVRKKHIFLNRETKSLTDIALKVFNSKFASTLYNLITRGLISANAKATVEFLEFFEEICSLFMCNTGNSKMVLLQHLNFFDKLKIVNAKGRDVTRRFHTINAWKITIKAAINLNNDSKNTMHWANIIPANDFQTELLNFCDKRNLTAAKFMSFFEKYVNQKTMETCLITIVNSYQTKRPFTFKNYSYRTVVLNENNPFKSLCGYLINESIKEHSCDLCRQFKQENDSLEYFIPSDSCHIRNIPLEGFETPQEHFLHFVFKMETIFLTDMPLFITGHPAKYLYELYMRENFAHSCPQFPKEYLIRLYIRFRIYKFIKETNKHLKATS